ncbi:MAG TPA: IPT/TIG domain-containing protein [Myxococcaceae bacterium]|nr:IPT/TIG domain-containing protein [Myxococcaceae bacterium]
MIQLKVHLTEPRPITTGTTSIADDGTSQGTQAPLGDMLGAALFSPGGTVSGAAVVSGGHVSISFFSPDGTFGTDEDSPIIAVSIPVRPDAVPEQTALLILDPSSSYWVAPSGETYEQEVVWGKFTVGGSVSISNIVPGGGLVPAGSTISVSGIGFQPGTLVQIEGVELESTLYVDPTRLDVVLAKQTQMHGKRVTVTNNDGSSATYYSYLRATPVGQSARPLLAATFPLFATGTFTSAFFIPPDDSALFFGLALQNPNATPSMVEIALFSSSYELLESSSFSLPSEATITREISEYLPGFCPPAGSYLRVLSDAPLQMLGLVANDADRSVVPVQPISG